MARMVIVLFCVDVVDQSLSLYDTLHELRKRLSLKGCTLCLICDDSAVKINLDLVTCLNTGSRIWSFYDRKSDIDSIAVENTCKCLGNDTAHTGSFDRDRCMLSG